MDAQQNSPESVVFLHGIGQDASVWNPHIAALPEGFQGLAPEVLALNRAGRLTLAGTSQGLLRFLDDAGIDSAHLCGLSLGAMIALDFAGRHPARVASLVLSGCQVRPNPRLMAVQNMLLRLLPARAMVPDGMSKAEVLSVFHEIASADLEPAARSVRVPTLVACGRKDRPNIVATRVLASLIPGSELRIIPAAGHTWNADMPEEFSRVLGEFLVRGRRDRDEAWQ